MSVGNSIMMQQFIDTCLAVMKPKPKYVYYVGTLAMFFTTEVNVYMSVRVNFTEAYEPKYVQYVCEEWQKVCGGNHQHANPALNSGPFDGHVTGTSLSVNSQNASASPTASSSFPADVH